MLKNKRILITGATGFIGANLARTLVTKGCKVSIFTRKSSDKWRIKDILRDVSEYEVDLQDAVRLGRAVKRIIPEIILHTAAYGSYPFQDDAKRMILVNLFGTISLLNISKKYGFELFINTGSSSEYGIKRCCMKEDDSLMPNTEYGISKAAASLYCQQIAGKEKLPVITLRLFSPYGYFEEPSRLMPTIISSFLKNKAPKLSCGSSVRDFVFIEDVISAYLKAIKKRGKFFGEAFNIGGGKQHSVKEVVDTIMRITSTKVRPRWNTLSNSRCEPKFWQADILKAKKLLNWSPRYELKTGLRKTTDWFKDNLNFYG